MHDMTIDFAPLKNVSEIYRKMRRGYHLCNADKGLFKELNDNEPAYQKFFDLLGYSLEKSSGESVDYYYLQQAEEGRVAGDGTEDRSNTSFRIIVFIGAMFDSATTNASSEESRLMDLFCGNGTVDKSFFESVFDDTVAAERLARSSVTQSDVAKIIKQMVMFNMLREEEGGRMRFLPPMQRIINLAARKAEQVNQQKMAQQMGAVQ